MGERLKKVRRLKHYEAALRDCMDIIWGEPQDFSVEKRREAADVLEDLARAWATCSLSLKDLRRLETSRHLYD